MEELAKIRETVGDQSFQEGRFAEALGLFQEVALGDQYVEFLTIPSYQHLN
jgi:malate synthase